MSEVTAPNHASSEEIHIAEQFVRARLEARTLTQYPGVVPTDFTAAYRCQDAAIARWPDRIGGWKVTNAFPPSMGFPVGDERMMGPAFSRNIRTAAGQVVECPVIAGGFSGVEPEIVIRVGRDAPTNKFDWTIDEAAEMVGELCIGIEVLSTPLPMLTSLGMVAIASDFCANFGIIVGGPITDWRTLDQITAQCFIEGKLEGRGSVALRDGPLSALAFILGKSARRGLPLKAGAVLASGTITGFHALVPGQSARMVFEGLGEVACRAVRVAAYSQQSAD